MREVGNEMYLSVEDIAGVGVSKDTVYDGMKTHSPQWQYIIDPQDGRKRLVRYETLADKYKNLLKTALWGGLEPREWVAMQDSANERAKGADIGSRLLAACESGYMSFILEYASVVKKTENEKLRQKQLRCLARAGAVMQALGQYYEENEIAWRDSGPIGPAAAWLKEHQARYFPLKYVPVNPVILKTKLREIYVLKKQITEVITLPRAGNDSHALHKEDQEVKSWCVQARMSGQNLSLNEIARRVRRACELTGKAAPSASWIKDLLAKPTYKRMCADSRWGKESGRAAFYKGYVPTTRALYAGDCWQMDGTRMNLLPHLADDDKKQRFLVVVVVRDVYSGDILGASFGVAENRWMYLDALKMAVKLTGYLPYELVHDKFPGHNSEEIGVTWAALKAVGLKKRTVSSVATGKAQTERWFGALQSVFLTRARYYYGEGIRSSRPHAHRSPELLEKLRKEAKGKGFDFDQAWQMAWEAIQAYRYTKINTYSKMQIDASPKDLHDTCEKMHVRGLEIWEQATVFWNETTLQIRRNVLTLTVRKHEYEYPITDMGILNTYDKLTVRYDEQDLGTVMAFDKGGVFVGELKERSRVQIFGPDAQWGEVNKIKAGNAAYVAAQREALRQELEGMSSLDDVIGNDIYLMGGRVPKSLLENSETELLKEQMIVVSEALKKQPSKPEKAVAVATVQEEEEVDPRDFILQGLRN